jgi:hypothetical protein
VGRLLLYFCSGCGRAFLACNPLPAYRLLPLCCHQDGFRGSYDEVLEHEAKLGLIEEAEEAEETLFRIYEAMVGAFSLLLPWFVKPFLSIAPRYLKELGVVFSFLSLLSHRLYFIV